MAEKNKSFPTVPSLVGEELYLRPATPEDIANTHHWLLQSDPQVLFDRPVPLLSAADAAEAFRKVERSADRQEFVAVRQADNMPVARIQFADLNPLNGSASLFVLVDPDERRKGYGSEALQILRHYLFRVRGLNRVHAGISARNEAAIKLLESSGFKREGTLRHQFFVRNEYHDGLIYSQLLFEFDG